MHTIVITEGVVLGKRGAGEANASVAILTNGLGLVWVSVRSARREISKLRYGVEPLTAGRFALVRGRNEWKLTGALDLKRSLGASAAGRAAAGRIAKLLMRLIHGEEQAPQIHSCVTAGFELLARAESKAELESVECVLVLRILFMLGYLPKTPELAPFLDGDLAAVETAASAARSRSMLIRAINESLTATGL